MKRKISGDTFSFQMVVNGVVVVHTGKIYADSCGLDIDYQGMKFHTTLRRVADKLSPVRIAADRPDRVIQI